MIRKNVLTYRGACEGLQEELYFKRLEELIMLYDSFSHRVAFRFHNCKGGSPKDIVLQAKKYAVNVNEDMCIAIYDHDFKSTSFLESLSLAKKYKVFPAFSIINFNLFLILHKKDYYKTITCKDNYEKDLRKAFGVPKIYDIKSRKAIEFIVNQIGLDDVKIAIERAKKLNEKSKKTQKIIIDDICEQPFLNIHLFLESVLEKLVKGMEEEMK